MRSSRTDGGAYGNRVAFLLAGAVKEADDMLPAPSRMVLLADDDIGGFEAPWLRSGVLREKPT